MSRVLKLSQSDYRIQVQSGGSIILDTGTASGTVTITGDLDVKGSTTTVESVNTTIKDNILQLNFGQTGNGISSTLDYRAGIQIGRGTYSDAQLVFDELIQHYDPATGTEQPGTFVFRTIDGKMSGIAVGSIANDGTSNIYFDLQNNDKILSVVNTINYEDRVTHDNDIPNRKFITNYVSATAGQADVDNIHKNNGILEVSRVAAGSSVVQVFIDTALRASVTSAGLNVDTINIFGHTIRNTGLLNTLMLTSDVNIVEIQGVLALNDQLSAPSTLPNTTQIYSSSTIGPGKSGLYFTNTAVTDELVAKNRALLLSMLF